MANLSKTQTILQALKSKLSRDLQKANDRCKELEWPLDESKPRILELEGDLAILNIEHAEALKGFVRKFVAESFDQVAALPREIIVLKETCRQEKTEVNRLEEAVAREEQKALAQHERFVDQHMINLRSMPRRTDTAEKMAAAVEGRLRPIYVRCSSPDLQKSKRPKRFRKAVKGELEAVKV